jgi:putative ABC transport system permease protein
MGSLWQDVKYGLRVLGRSPGFAAVAILTLALGIGANAAIFSLLNSVLLRPLPVERPGRLVLFETAGPYGLNTSFNTPLYRDYCDRNSVFSGFVSFADNHFTLSQHGPGESLEGLIVSGNYFDVLGVRPALGRLLQPLDDRPGAAPAVVLGYRLWQRRFASDPAILGKSVLIDNRDFTVIGVTPARFTGTLRGFLPDVYVTTAMQPIVMPAPGLDPLNDRRFTWLYLMGRLKPGVSRGQAQASLRALATQIHAATPMNTETDVVLRDGSGGQTERVSGFEAPLLLLMCAVGLVLLIACANIANLLLVRGEVRRREVAVRLAIGASRAQLLRQFLVESLLIAVAGGVLGAVLANWLANWLVTLHPPASLATLSASATDRVDWRMLGFLAAVTVLAGFTAGLAPAWQSVRAPVTAGLKDDAAGGGRRRWNLRSGLVVSQVALSLVVLVASGLTLRSLARTESIDPGFQPAKVLLAPFDLGNSGYSADRGRVFLDELQRRAAALPGVESAGLVVVSPLSGHGMRWTVVGADGRMFDQKPNFDFNIVAPGYFRTLQIPLLAGRDFDSRDTPNSPLVVIVNRAGAERLWPGRNPIGRHLMLPSLPPGKTLNLEVVGVVGDSRYRNLLDPIAPAMYLPFAQAYRGHASLILRTAGAPGAMAASARTLLAALDPSVPIGGVTTMREQESRSLYEARMVALLLGAFGLLSLALAVVGIYGVSSYTVARRTQEIGLRMALGARPEEVLRMVLRQGATLAGIGIAAGVLAALALTHLMRSLLYGTSTADPLTFAATAAVLAAVALLACSIPALRATRIDPMAALRHE